MKKILAVISILYLLSNMVFATTITSVVCGDWTTPTTWNLFRLPEPTDTIVVNTFVKFDTDFTSASPGMLNVTVCGTLCGLHHYTGYFLFDGVIYVYGLTAGYGHSISNSDINIQQFISVNGGSYQVFGNTCIGCSSQCQNCNVSMEERFDCSPDGLSNPVAKHPLYCYPNPASNRLNIQGILRRTLLTLYDLPGKPVVELESLNDAFLDLSLLPAGIYTLVSKDSNGRTFNKIIIAK